MIFKLADEKEVHNNAYPSMLPYGRTAGMLDVMPNYKFVFGVPKIY